MFLASAGDVAVRGNVFDLRSAAPTAEPLRGAIVAVSTTGVEISGNTWILPESGAVAGVSYEADSVEGLRVFGNQVRK